MWYGVYSPRGHGSGRGLPLRTYGIWGGQNVETIGANLCYLLQFDDIGSTEVGWHLPSVPYGLLCNGAESCVGDSHLMP